MDPEVVTPGHGPVGDRRALEDTLGYLLLLCREARRGFAEGATAREVAERIRLGGYAEWAESWRVLSNVMKIYQELAGDPATPLDLKKAPGD